MWKEISHWTVLAHERKNSGSFQRMAKFQNLLTEAHSCGWLLQHTPPAGGVAMLCETRTWQVKWVMPVLFLVRNPIFSTDWLGIQMALKSKSQWMENSSERHWWQREITSSLWRWPQDTRRQKLNGVDSLAQCSVLVLSHSFSGTIRGRILYFSFGSCTLQVPSKVLCSQQFLLVQLGR